MISKKHGKVCATLNYTEHFLVSTFRVFISISAFTFLIAVPIGTTSSAIALKFCALAAEIKKYKSIIEKKKKKHNKTVFLAKSKLNKIEVLISKSFIDSVIIQDKFVLINNVLKKYNEMKEVIKNLKT